MLRRAIKTGEECDVHEWRRYLVWHRGEVRAAKRRTNKRERREGRREVGLVTVVDMHPETVPYPVDAEHPPVDFNG